MHSNRLLRWSRIPAARKRRKTEGGKREKKRMDGGEKRERGEREMEMEKREGGVRGRGVG